MHFATIILPVMVAARKPAYRSLNDFFDRSGQTPSELIATLKRSGVAIGKSHLSLIRSGQRRPSLPVAVALAKAADVPVESLMAGAA